MNLKRKIVKLIPNAALKFAKGALYNYKCPVCESAVKDFLPLPDEYYKNLEKYRMIYNYDQIETLNHSKYRCPICLSNDRDRIYTLYLKDFFRSAEKKKYNLVDFGPSLGFSNWLKKQDKIRYRSADLFLKDVDDKVDITDMQLYKDGQFDIFICSHILEHVIDPNKALAELFRITSKGGWGIIMVPLVNGIEETQEDPTHESAEDRWKNYLQNDHLRLFGKSDFVRRIEKAGFLVKAHGVDFFGEKIFSSSAISKSSVLYIAQKN
jgi:SAM-dependent methyltransferase